MSTESRGRHERFVQNTDHSIQDQETGEEFPIAVNGPLWIATDVFEENADENIHLFTRTNHHGSLMVDDAPWVHGGTFNLMLENRGGAPYLVVWAEKDFDDDPTFTIRLDKGELE